MTVFRIDCQVNESRHSVSAFFGKFHSLLYCLECLIQVLNNIVDILGTNGKTDGIRFDSLIQKFFFCTLAVCGGRRVDDQRFHICYVSEQREQLQVIDEVFCFLCISLDFEGEDRTASVREIFLIKSLLLRVLGYRRMMN